MELQEFVTIISEVNSRKFITVEKKCNAIMFTNIGTSVAFVNTFPLNPGSAGVFNGESLVIGGNLGETLIGRYEVKFTGNAGAVMVTQKIYNTK